MNLRQISADCCNTTYTYILHPLWQIQQFQFLRYSLQYGVSVNINVSSAKTNENILYYSKSTSLTVPYIIDLQITSLMKYYGTGMPTGLVTGHVLFKQLCRLQSFGFASSSMRFHLDNEMGDLDKYVLLHSFVRKCIYYVIGSRRLTIYFNIRPIGCIFEKSLCQSILSSILSVNTTVNSTVKVYFMYF